MSNLSSSDEEFDEAVERVTPPKDALDNKLTLPFPRNHVKSSHQQHQLSSTDQKNHANVSNAQTKGHKKANSTSYEEYMYGNKHHTSCGPPPPSLTHHLRGHSWSEASLTAGTYSSQQQERYSHEGHRPTSLLLGVDDQFHPLNHETPPNGRSYIKVKTKIKTNKRFNRLVLAQTLAVDTAEVYATADIDPIEKFKGENTNDSKQPVDAVWTSRFSKNGKYMATGGQSCVINIWKVLRDLERGQDNMDVQDMLPHEPSIKVFHDAPVRIYIGHTADILDISWSKNNFIVSSSMDKTVRLWHVSQKVCLCVFRHLDIVTSVKFHPKDDRFFLSGSFDCRVRLWSIPEKRVAFWNEIPGRNNAITAVGFTFDGRTVCVGADSGDMFFFETQGLKYNTQILVKSHRSKHGKKITGIEPMPGMPLGEERILVTTNESRVWIINMMDKSFVHEYKGIENPAMQIKASFSDDGRFIICGSEDGCVYLWCTDQVRYSPFQRLQDSRIKAAVALGHLGDQMLQTAMEYGNFSSGAHPKRIAGWLQRGERRVIDKLRGRNEHFVAHQHAVTSAIFAPTKTRQMLARAGGDSILDSTPVYTHINSTSSDVDVDDLMDYEDVVVREQRKSLTSSDLKHYLHMDEFGRSLLHELSKATPEERDRFAYPDSQIIISADLHGSIKVWRMDSGFYNDEPDSSQEEEFGADSSETPGTLFSSASEPSSIRSNTTTTEFSMKSSRTSSKKSALSSLFSRFK